MRSLIFNDADERLTFYANGDMATATIDGHASTFSYDYDDQLTSLSSSNSTVSYLYDALGRRIYRDDATGLAHTFIFDGGRLVAEHNESTQTRDTVYTYGYDLLDKQGTGGTEFPLYDGQGNTYQTLTASGTYVLSGDIMNDFGQHFGGVSGTNDLSYQWRASSGYRTEGDGPWTGSYNEPIVLVGARYYMPSMGVFLTRDTDLGQKPYQYCNADPVNYVDPTGHDLTKLISMTFGYITPGVLQAIADQSGTGLGSEQNPSPILDPTNIPVPGGSVDSTSGTATFGPYSVGSGNLAYTLTPSTGGVGAVYTTGTLSISGSYSLYGNGTSLGIGSDPGFGGTLTLVTGGISTIGVKYTSPF